jgi:predicted dehydrogenase
MSGGAATAAGARADRWRKLLRFVAIYGPGRTLFKAAGRLRLRPPALTRRRASADIGLIGCGQFGFATIGYFLQSAFGPRIAACHDIDPAAARSLASALRVERVCSSVDELLATPGLRTVYIASNHASHADYSSRALARGLDVYVEKPIAVDDDQLLQLLRARRAASGRLFAGYNRPFSGALRWLRERLAIDPAQGITLQCFVVGHQLGTEHWYRRPEEGTRVCGNIGHWLDLMVHVLSWRGRPDRVDIALTWADAAEPDDNVAIAIASDRGDLFAVTLSSRSEPFEGIRESLHFQHGQATAEIDDFRRISLWQGPRLQRRRFWPKDVGHRRAILQPFAGDDRRDWHEVELSTMLMLHITGMVRRRERQSAFSFTECEARLARELAAPIDTHHPT